jgi:hypothetical protein
VKAVLGLQNIAMYWLFFPIAMHSKFVILAMDVQIDS